MSDPLPSFFRDNFSTDRMARFCVVWRATEAKCGACGGVVLHGTLDGPKAQFWCCRDCPQAGILPIQPIAVKLGAQAGIEPATFTL